MKKRNGLSSAEDSQMIHQLLIGLRYHVQTQYLLSSRKAKQRIVVWIAVTAMVLTSIFAITG